jgi:hypothetical protein
MTKSKLIIPGIYKHKKGNLYKTLYLAHHSETLEELVVYECLYENELNQIWVRPKEMFLERFDYVGDKKTNQPI